MTTVAMIWLIFWLHKYVFNVFLILLTPIVLMIVYYTDISLKYGLFIVSLGPSIHDSGSDQCPVNGCCHGLPADPEVHHCCLKACLLWQDHTWRSGLTLALAAFSASRSFFLPFHTNKIVWFSWLKIGFSIILPFILFVPDQFPWGCLKLPQRL